jgi:hypothetical protein
MGFCLAHAALGAQIPEIGAREAGQATVLRQQLVG